MSQKNFKAGDVIQSTINTDIRWQIMDKHLDSYTIEYVGSDSYFEQRERRQYNVVSIEGGTFRLFSKLEKTLK